MRNGSRAGIEPWEMSVNRCPAESVSIARRSTSCRFTSELLEPLVDQSPAIDELGLEPLELALTSADELQLACDVAQRLLEDAAPPARGLGLVPFRPALGPPRLRLEQLPQLLQ